MTLYSGDPTEAKENTEVATKAELWRPLSRAVGGFDLDPASGAEPTPIADERYTREDDGLSEPWFGQVWLNPPFGDKLEWFRRLVDQYNNGDVTRAVALAPVDSGADWFQHWFITADVHGWLNGRDWYISTGNSSPSFNTVVGVWNVNDELLEALHGLGVVTNPTDPPTEQTSLFDHD